MDDLTQAAVSDGAPAGIDADEHDSSAGPELESAPTEPQPGSAPAFPASAAGMSEDVDGGGGSLQSGGPNGLEGPAHSVDFLRSVEVQASVELGRVVLPIGEVLRLAPGSVVHLDKMLGDPVDLMIKDRLIAKGEVVVVDDKFGLRITEIVSSGSEPADRHGG